MQFQRRSVERAHKSHLEQKREEETEKELLKIELSEKMKITKKKQQKNIGEAEKMKNRLTANDKCLEEDKKKLLTRDFN